MEQVSTIKTKYFIALLILFKKNCDVETKLPLNIQPFLSLYMIYFYYFSV